MGLEELEEALSTGKTVYFAGYRLHENDRLHFAADKKGKKFFTDFTEANTARQTYADKKNHLSLEIKLYKIAASEVQISSE